MMVMDLAAIKVFGTGVLHVAPRHGSEFGEKLERAIDGRKRDFWCVTPEMCQNRRGVEIPALVP